MEEADLEFRITPGDGEVPLLQHLLHSASSTGLLSDDVLPRRPDTSSPWPSPQNEHIQPIPTDMF